MSVDQESLSEILPNNFGSKAPPAEKPVATDVKPAEPAAAAPSAAKEPEQAEEPKPERTRDESGRFTKAEEKPPEREKPRADVAAIIDERRKRQEVEKRLNEVLQSQQKPPAEKPSVFDNEDAAIRSRVDEATKPLREMLYNQSIRYARATYKDAFGEAETAFLEAAERDERLLEGLRASTDPGEYIYMHGMFHKELAGVGGDLLKYREQVTADLTGKLSAKDQEITTLKAELDALKKAQADLDSVPRSLNNLSSGSTPKVGDADPEDIKSIVRFGNQQR